jgi:hypothetical protein
MPLGQATTDFADAERVAGDKGGVICLMVSSSVPHPEGAVSLSAGLLLVKLSRLCTANLSKGRIDLAGSAGAV